MSAQGHEENNSGASISSRLVPRKRTCSGHQATSQKCQKQSFSSSALRCQGPLRAHDGPCSSRNRSSNKVDGVVPITTKNLNKVMIDPTGNRSGVFKCQHSSDVLVRRPLP